MNLHLVGGFLGSGKTTAIISASKILIEKGKRVGVITNDQGKYLVDTAFVKASDLPAVEVTGGCFCCQYGDLETEISGLMESYQPDVIFAESVGSCADLIATVVKPMIEFAGKEIQPSSFSVFADIRLARRWLLGETLPFSDDVTYIFEKQMEEAGFLVLNKIDLLPENKVVGSKVLAAGRFPDKFIMAQQANDAQKITAWVEAIETGAFPQPKTSLHIDYDRYGSGEARLVWLDQEIRFWGDGQHAGEVAACFMQTLRELIMAQNLPVGHVKCFLRSGGFSAKTGFSAADLLPDAGWQADVLGLRGNDVAVMLNARLEAKADQAQTLVEQAASACASKAGWSYQTGEASIFYPDFPKPQHRIA